MQMIEGNAWEATREEECHAWETIAGEKGTAPGLKCMSGRFHCKGLIGSVNEHVGIVLLGRQNIAFQAFIRFASDNPLSDEVQWVATGEWWPKFKSQTITGRQCLVFIDDNVEVPA